MGGSQFLVRRSQRTAPGNQQLKTVNCFLQALLGEEADEVNDAV
jgi:hypothetical protein